MHDTDDAGFADLAVHDTYPMELDIRTDTGYIDAKIRRTASWFPKFTHDAHQGDEAPGGPGRLRPFEFAVPGLGGASGLLLPGFGTSPAGGSFLGIDGLLGMVAGESPPFGGGASGDAVGGGNAASYRPDLEALMRLEEATIQLGYSGPAERSFATYLAFPDTSRLNIPLATGLGVASPLNVTYGNDFYTHHREHTYPDFHGDATVRINADPGNVMNATRHGSILVIEPDGNFGPMLHIGINGDRFPSAMGVMGDCTSGCKFNVGWGGIHVTGYNQWGGQAHFYSGEQEEPPPPQRRLQSDEGSHWDWLVVAALVAFGVLAYRLLGNRMQYGVWSLGG